MQTTIQQANDPLLSEAGRLIQRVERLFGRRPRRVEVAAVKVVKNADQQAYIMLGADDPKTVTIFIPDFFDPSLVESEKPLRPGDPGDPGYALRTAKVWQRQALIHECAHVVLGPCQKEQVTAADEGLAEVARTILNYEDRKEFPWLPSTVNRGWAEMLAWKLLSHDREAVLKMRIVQPWVYKLTPEIILKTAPHVGQFYAERLCSPFTYNNYGVTT